MPHANSDVAKQAIYDKKAAKKDKQKRDTMIAAAAMIPLMMMPGMMGRDSHNMHHFDDGTGHRWW